MKDSCAHAREAQNLQAHAQTHYSKTKSRMNSPERYIAQTKTIVRSDRQPSSNKRCSTLSGGKVRRDIHRLPLRLFAGGGNAPLLPVNAPQQRSYPPVPLATTVHPFVCQILLPAIATRLNLQCSPAACPPPPSRRLCPQGLALRIHALHF